MCIIFWVPGQGLPFLLIKWSVVLVSGIQSLNKGYIIMMNSCLRYSVNQNIITSFRHKLQFWIILVKICASFVHHLGYLLLCIPTHPVCTLSL